MTSRFPAARLCALVCVALTPTPLPARAQETGYSVAPLLRFRPLARDSLRIAYRGFPEWFRENKADIDPMKYSGVREELYLIIDSFIRYVYDDTGRTYLERSPSMAELFDLGTEIGAIGAGMVATSLAPESRESMHPTLLPDSGMVLDYVHPTFTLRSDHGWSVRFPYYFLLWSASRLNIGNGITGQVVVWSTLFGGLATEAGRAPSTITVLSSNSTPRDTFEEYWLATLEINAGDEVDEALVPGGRTYRSVDRINNLMKELVTLEGPDGPLMIAYTGKPGPFDSNRDHFLDFLRLMRF